MHVFISHSNKGEDKEITRALVDYLTERKVFCWADLRDMQAGYWDSQIGKAFTDAAMYIFVASRNSLTSPECANELRMIGNSPKRDRMLPYFADDYYFTNVAAQEQQVYRLGAFQGIKRSAYTTQEEAFFALYSLLPKELTVLDANPADFVFGDDMATIKRYTGSDAAVNVPNAGAIAERAFLKCTTLQKVIIPESVCSIGKYAFSDCPHLCFAEGMQGVTECASTVADRSPVLKTENGVRYFGPIAVGAEGDPEELVLREGTRVIASGAFRELFSLQKVHLPASIVSICDGAFTDCIRLREINVPQNAQVSKTAFCGCEQYQPKN